MPERDQLPLGMTPRRPYTVEGAAEYLGCSATTTIINSYKRKRDMNAPPLTAARARELLECDPLCGLLIWRARAGDTREIKRWNSRYAGKRAGSAHGERRRLAIEGRGYYEHRVIWLIATGEWPPEELDHKNRQPGENRIDNLRLATGSQNNCNSKLRSDNTSGFKGVFWDRTRWVAKIGSRYVGSYKTREDAARAYAEAARRVYGEFANPAKREPRS